MTNARSPLDEAHTTFFTRWKNSPMHRQYVANTLHRQLWSMFLSLDCSRRTSTAKMQRFASTNPGARYQRETKRKGNEIDVVASRSFARIVARRSSLARSTPLFPCLHDVPTVFSIAVVAANEGRPGNTELPFNLVKSSKSFPQASGRKVLALSDFTES